VVSEFRRHVVKETGHRDIEDLTELKQSTCANAIRGGFIFLNLLKTHPDGFSQCSLVHATEFTQKFNAFPDVNIYGTEGGILELFTLFHLFLLDHFP